MKFLAEFENTIHKKPAQANDEITLLAFSSLPKAVDFMQPAVLQGLIHDVNKVGKFGKETVKNWGLPIVLNPTLEKIQDFPIDFLELDANTAEASDE